jgi:hypothetical protein
MIQRFSVAVLLLALILIAVSESSANPGQEQHDVNSVADAIRYLQDLESRHQFARPRWEFLFSFISIVFLQCSSIFYKMQVPIHSVSMHSFLVLNVFLSPSHSRFTFLVLFLLLAAIFHFRLLKPECSLRIDETKCTREQKASQALPHDKRFRFLRFGACEVFVFVVFF